MYNIIVNAIHMAFYIISVYGSLDPSSPIDVQVVNRTDVSVKVVWKTPVTPNGQIAYYKVSYIMGNHSHGTNVSDLRTSNVTGTREDILQNLKPFTVYTVWVQAVNIEGINHLVGNKSVEKTFQTLKAGRWISLVVQQNSLIFVLQSSI